MNLSRVLKNAGWVLADRIVRLIGGFFVGIWVAKYLKADGFGLLSTASAVTLLLSPFAALGLDGILVRDLARFPGRAAELMPAALAMRIAGGLLAWAGGYLAVRLTCPASGDAAIVYLIVLLGNLAAFGDVFDAHFQSRMQVAVPTGIRVLSFLLANGVRMVAVANRWSISLIAGTLVLEPLVASVLLSTFGVRKVAIRLALPSLSSVKYLLREAAPLAAALFCYLVFSRLDQLIVMSALGAHDAGIYAISTRFLEIPLIGGMAVAGALFPYLAQKDAEGASGVRLDPYKPWIVGASLLGWLWMAFWLVSGESLIVWLFGVDYQGAGHITALRSAGLLFLLNGFLRSTYLTNTGQQKVLFYTSVVGAVFSLAINYAGAAYGGLTGVAITYSVSQCLVLFLMSFILKSTREYGLVQWRGLFLLGAFGNRPIRSVARPGTPDLSP